MTTLQEKYEAQKKWLQWGLEEGSSLDYWVGPTEKGSIEQKLWELGRDYGSKYKKLMDIYEGRIVGKEEVPEEFKTYFIPKGPMALRSIFPKKLYLVGTTNGATGWGSATQTYSTPKLGLIFEDETSYWNPTTLRKYLLEFLRTHQNVLLEEIVKTATQQEVEKEKSMAYNAGSTPVSTSSGSTPVSTSSGSAAKEAPKKTLTISPVNARVLRMQSLKVLRAASKSFVENNLPKEERAGVMKVIGDLLDRNIPDGAILSLASWASSIVPIPARFQGIAEVVNKEFHDEGEALIKDAGIDIVKEVAGPILMNLYSMAEKYFEEVPVEVGPDKQIEGGLDIKAMKDDLEKEKVPVAKKSTAQKVA